MSETSRTNGGGADIGTGGAPTDRRGGSQLPRWFRPAAIVVGVLVVGLFPLGEPGNLYIQTVLILTLLLVVSSSGWNIISGFAGYVSLGQSAFIGVGASRSGSSRSTGRAFRPGCSRRWAG